MSRRRNTLRIALASAAVAGAFSPRSRPRSRRRRPRRWPPAPPTSPARSVPTSSRTAARASVHEPKAGHFQVAVSKGDIMLAVLDGKRPYATVHNLFVEMDVRNGRVTWVAAEEHRPGQGPGQTATTRGAYVGNRALAGGIRCRRVPAVAPRVHGLRRLGRKVREAPQRCAPDRADRQARRLPRPPRRPHRPGHRAAGQGQQRPGPGHPRLLRGEEAGHRRGAPSRS
ncbi:hypothetical protein [Streptomyces thioluteus]|uniref:hypothetical protein n=1 Tax=Streptomyces thioluteus TaxID=66431 RepID=UPI0031F14161